MAYVPKIAIIGAGPAGLTLAHILSKHTTPSTIFESDASPDERSQGGSLDLHPLTGQAALHAADLHAKFIQYARGIGCGEDLMVSDKDGTLRMDFRGVDTGRPEIDRAALKKILLEDIPECITIRWGHKLRAATRDDLTGNIILDFGETQETGFDLVVGADGAWSKVRHLLTPIRPFYSGLSGLEFDLVDPDTTHPHIASFVGNGSHGVQNNQDGGQVLLCQRQGNKDIRVYAWVLQPETWLQDHHIDVKRSPEKAKQLVLNDYTDWTPEMRNIIESCDVYRMTARSLYMLPVGLTWAPRKDVTLVGDAAHLMTPFAGEGVNAALTDALELAQSLLASRNDVKAAIAEYESKMFSRTKPLMQQTWDLSQIWFQPRCIDILDKRFASEMLKN